jgi:hypothetical protein
MAYFDEDTYKIENTLKAFEEKRQMRRSDKLSYGTSWVGQPLKSPSWIIYWNRDLVYQGGVELFNEKDAKRAVYLGFQTPINSARDYEVAFVVRTISEENYPRYMRATKNKKDVTKSFFLLDEDREFSHYKDDHPAMQFNCEDEEDRISLNKLVVQMMRDQVVLNNTDLIRYLGKHPEAYNTITCKTGALLAGVSRFLRGKAEAENNRII